ncbi:dTDP-4-dehydrorhamnose reductase [Pseudoalteromonas elyakovii]|nr:dTDP-4-dehydrorhamnose reductase [Pseudoalteromonas elyakovii]
MKVLLTGANGQLGLCFQDCISNSIELTALSSKELDITCKAAVQRIVNTVKPDVIVNCAAYTAVDKAESEPKLAHDVNCQGPENLAYATAMLDIPLIHVSTDYVFDGNATEPYLSTDATSPQGVYGQTKLAGEQAIMAVTSKYIIIRTAWVFSEYGNNFVKTMLNLSAKHSELKVISDQIGTPTYAGDLAKFLSYIIEHGKYYYGLYHFNGGQTTSWYEFAKEIFKVAKMADSNFDVPDVFPINSDEYPSIAKRPMFSVLDSSLTDSVFERRTSASWSNSLIHVIKKLLVK